MAPNPNNVSPAKISVPASHMIFMLVQLTAVPCTVEWSSFLGQHDPIWPMGPQQRCEAISQYDPLPGLCGGPSITNGNCGPSVGTADCSLGNATQCLDVYGLACEQEPKCSSFGVAPAWHGGKTAQLYATADAAHAVDNPQWSLYVKNASAPKRQVCVTTSANLWTRWEDGPFVGNGLVGGLVRFNTSAGRTALRIDLGRSGVWDRRSAASPPGVFSGSALFDRPRLPIGHLELELPTANLSNGSAFRIDMFRAEAVASIHTLCSQAVPHFHWPSLAASLDLRLVAPHGVAAGLVLELNSSGLAVPVPIAFVAEESRSTRTKSVPHAATGRTRRRRAAASAAPTSRRSRCWRAATMPSRGASTLTMAPGAAPAPNGGSAYGFLSQMMRRLASRPPRPRQLRR